MTVVVPRGRATLHEPVFAGCHRLNGNGEMTGLEWIRESGMLTTPIAITNTHSVGVVRDALVADFDAPPRAVRRVVVAAGRRRDVGRPAQRPERLPRPAGAPARGARRGTRRPGRRGRRRGRDRDRSATSSRAGSGPRRGSSPAALGGYTVGALVQANYGKRDWLRVDGVPVGAEIGIGEVSSPFGDRAARSAPCDPPGSGSIIVVIATDAPLLPHQCERLAQRAGLGIARAGGTGGHTSGDLFVAFATGNRLPIDDEDDPRSLGYDVRAVGDGVIDALFDGVIEATEEAIVNALVAAQTMAGRDGITAHALPHDRLVEVMTRFGRGRTGPRLMNRAVRPVGAGPRSPPRTLRSVNDDDISAPTVVAVDLIRVADPQRLGTVRPTPLVARHPAMHLTRAFDKSDRWSWMTTTLAFTAVSSADSLTFAHHADCLSGIS